MAEGRVSRLNAFCVMDAAGKVLARGPRWRATGVALFEMLREHCPCPERIVMETMSAWLARELGKMGMPVAVIDARQAHAVMKLPHNKTDARGAELLAEIARTGFCRPVSVASAAAQAARILLKARCRPTAARR